MNIRQIAHTRQATTQAEGAGATVHRTIGTQDLSVLDPFLLLDEFEFKASTGGGFPDHPHRGFETVTYMFKGKMAHEDTAGNAGIIGPGEVQWMTAGAGLVHSEMPQPEDDGSDLIHGMQLWVNLPAKDKMIAPRYQDIEAAHIPTITGDGYTAKLIAGEVEGVSGPVTEIAVNPLYMDVTLTGESAFFHVGADRTAFLYTLTPGIKTDGLSMAARTLAVLTDGDTIAILGRPGDRFMLIAAEPIGEPVARYGPFVMNTREEIMSTIEDWNKGTFLKAG